MINYLVDPNDIEKASFEKIKRLTNVKHLQDQEKLVAWRLVHTCGQPEIIQNIRFSRYAVEKGKQALKKKSVILCDVEMLKKGLSARFLAVKPKCYLNQKKVADLAKQRGHTRTMTALDWWIPKLDGSIAMIGNAPTALFRLIELIENSCVKPALIIAIPVGFIGAAESKQLLWDQHQKLGVECITLLGRSGGSAMSASVLNAIARLDA